jgi:hypothetical protein
MKEETLGYNRQYGLFLNVEDENMRSGQQQQQEPKTPSTKLKTEKNLRNRPYHYGIRTATPLEVP